MLAHHLGHQPNRAFDFHLLGFGRTAQSGIAREQRALRLLGQGQCKQVVAAGVLVFLAQGLHAGHTFGRQTFDDQPHVTPMRMVLGQFFKIKHIGHRKLVTQAEHGGHEATHLHINQDVGVTDERQHGLAPR